MVWMWNIMFFLTVHHLALQALDALCISMDGEGL